MCPLRWTGPTRTQRMVTWPVPLAGTCPCAPVCSARAFDPIRRWNNETKSSQELYVLTLVQSLPFFMVSSAGLSEELTVTVAVLCMPGRVSKQNKPRGPHNPGHLHGRACDCW